MASSQVLQHNDIILETSLEADNIDIEAVLLAWEELHPYSVEAVTARCAEPFEFAASDQCIMFAAVQRLPTKPVEGNAEEDGKDKGAGEPPVSPSQYAWPEARDIDNTWDAAAPQLLESPSTPQPSEQHTSTIHTIGILFLRTTDMVSEYNICLSLLPEWRNQGLAAQALTAGLAYAFDNLWAHRVQGLIMDGPSSDAARSIFTSLGFKCEGTRRRALISPAAPGYRDVVSLAMLDTEWHVRAQGGHGVRGVWDEMFVRHHREQEELLQLEERRRKLRRTASMETVRGGGAELALTSGPPSPSTSSVDLGAHSPRDAGTPSPASDSDADGSLSVPSSPASDSSTFSWSDLDESAAPRTPLLRKRRKGKGRVASSTSRTPYRSEDWTSDASSDWDVL